jgi:diguanylate cyclase (GGDEF)-like protein/PAS domain S-box-containing protein
VPRRRQWHRVYYGLAFFDVLVVALGLFLNHQIIDTHHEAIRVNQVWEKRLDRYLDLGTTAGEVNAPGNDVFDSRNVGTESARRDEALVRFDAQMETIRRDLHAVPPRYAGVLRADLEVLEARMADMVAEADLIFGYFNAGRPDLAGSRMAAMDRRYHEVNAAITNTREDVGDIQQELFSQQADHAETLRDFELLIAAFVVVMISMATGYGHRIKKELESRDAERARYIVELEESHRQLAGANVLLSEEVAARVQAEASLRLSEERYALAARGANDGLWDWDLKTAEVYYAPRWKTLLGFPEDALGSGPGEWLDRVHLDDRDELHARLEAAIEAGGTFEIEHRVRHRDGSYRWMSARGVAIAREGVRRLVGSHSDVTARKEAELSLVHDSLHDALTGLPNRVLFLDRLEHALQRGRRSSAAPFAAMYVDLDRFKQINDALGHLAGDELLVRFADVLRDVIRPGDTAARLGGDEFAVLLEDVHSEDDAATVAQRILDRLRQPFLVDDTEVYTSASIGIAMGQTRYTSTTEVIRHADAALYRAKRDGRGRLQVFEPERFEQALDNLRIEVDLRGALARNELHLLYQPIVELTTEKIIGVEALVRWNHPKLGAIPPSTFIPVAEESGDITAIGDWVLLEACRSIAGLDSLSVGASTFVSVNVSPHQLLRPDFAERVQATLTATGLAAERLRLEITESAIVRDRAHATRQLQQLRELGVLICIDDFGTGHSALSYVQDLPVDGIKIDRSFVNRLVGTANGGHVIQAILDLARNTGLNAVAEGVETEQQQAALLRLSCEHGQGYLFDRPLSLDALVERLEPMQERAS